MKVLNDLLFSLRELWTLRKLEHGFDWFYVMHQGHVVLQVVRVSISSFAVWTSLVFVWVLWSALMTTDRSFFCDVRMLRSCTLSQIVVRILRLRSNRAGVNHSCLAVELFRIRWWRFDYFYQSFDFRLQVSHWIIWKAHLDNFLYLIIKKGEFEQILLYSINNR